MESVETLILGAGLAGLSTAWHLKREALLLDAGARPGGLAITNEEMGFRFDVTGHWLHMRDPDIRSTLGALVPMDEVVRLSKIYSHNRLIAYPYQSNLKDLPDDVKVACLMGAVDAHVRRQMGVVVPDGFGGFVLHHFGEGIAREFMFPYNTKLWGVSPDEISHAWCQRFVPVPDLRQIVEGALTDRNQRTGYNARFSYPEKQGIEAFSAAIAREVPAPLLLGHKVVAVHAGEQWVETEQGKRFTYEHLVTSLPLKSFVELWLDAPPEVKAAGKRLRCTSLSYLDLGIRGPALQGLHWVYLPDPSMAAYRIGCFSNASAAMAPQGCSSLYVELGNHAGTDDDSALNQVLEVLSSLDSPVSREDVLVCRKRTVDYAYVVYDFAYEESRATIMKNLEKHQIQSIGRYGKWEYASMEDALLDGREAARRITEEFHG